MEMMAAASLAPCLWRAFSWSCALASADWIANVQDEYYARAKTALNNNNEDGARAALTLRQAALDALPAAEKELDEATFRSPSTMQSFPP